MGTVLGIVLPAFGVILAGYVAARTPLFPPAACRGLSNFVFYAAMPAFLFRAMAVGAPPEGIGLGIVYAYFVACLVMFAATLVLSRALFRTRLEERAVMAMGTVFGNTVMLGIPLVYAAFGEAGVVYVMLVIAFHSVILIPLTIVVIELGRGSGRGLAHAARSIAAALARNPVILAIAAGWAWRAGGLELPEGIGRFTGLLGAAGVPTALFALGATLVGYRIAGDVRESMTVVALKLAAQPIAVWLSASFLGLGDLETAVAVVLGALPTGINVFIMAEAYSVHERSAATAILVSTVLSVATMSAVLGILAPAR
ncbi:MAG: AEC family transporter [Alphaproteobacteria bacterium]